MCLLWYWSVVVDFLIVVVEEVVVFLFVYVD